MTERADDIERLIRNDENMTEYWQSRRQVSELPPEEIPLELFVEWEPRLAWVRQCRKDLLKEYATIISQSTLKEMEGHAPDWVLDLLHKRFKAPNDPRDPPPSPDSWEGGYFG